MNAYQGPSSWASTSSYPIGTSCYYPTPAPESPVSPRRKSRNRVSRSSNSGPAHHLSPYTQYPDSPAISPLNVPQPMPCASVNALLGNHNHRYLSYDVTQPPNTALVFSESQQEYRQISLRKSKQPVLLDPTERTYTLEYEHPTVGRQFISTFESSGTILSLLSGIYEYFQEKLSAPEFAMLSQMGDVYKEAQMSMLARLGHNRSSYGSSYGVRKVDFLGERVILQGVELDMDGRGRPSVLLIKFTTRSG